MLNTCFHVSAAASGDSEAHPREDEERREGAGGGPAESGVTQGLPHTHMHTCTHTCTNAEAFLTNADGNLDIYHLVSGLQVSASAVLEDSEAVFADVSVRLEKTKAEVRSRSDGLAFITTCTTPF